jgi:hypothetical protein
MPKLLKGNFNLTSNVALNFVGWRWRDRKGLLHAPSEMETRHLFYTLRMIWNNFMPAEMRVGSVRLYRFGKIYTSKYFTEAIIALGKELSTRNDLELEWLSELEMMAAWFKERRTTLFVACIVAASSGAVHMTLPEDL